MVVHYPATAVLPACFPGTAVAVAVVAGGLGGLALFPHFLDHFRPYQAIQPGPGSDQRSVDIFISEYRIAVGNVGGNRSTSARCGCFPRTGRTTLRPRGDARPGPWP